MSLSYNEKRKFEEWQKKQMAPYGVEVKSAIESKPSTTSKQQTQKQTPPDYWDRIIRTSSSGNKKEFDEVKKLGMPKFDNDAQKKLYFHRTSSLFGYNQPKSYTHLEKDEEEEKRSKPVVADYYDKVSPFLEQEKEKNKKSLYAYEDKINEGLATEQDDIYKWLKARNAVLNSGTAYAFNPIRQDYIQSAENKIKEEKGDVVEKFENQQPRDVELVKKYADGWGKSANNTHYGNLVHMFEVEKEDFEANKKEDQGYEDYFEENKRNGYVTIEPEDFEYINANYGYFLENREKTLPVELEYDKEVSHQVKADTHGFDKVQGDMAKREWTFDIGGLIEATNTPEESLSFIEQGEKKIKEIALDLETVTDKEAVAALNVKRKMVERMVEAAKNENVEIKTASPEQLETNKNFVNALGVKITKAYTSSFHDIELYGLFSRAKREAGENWDFESIADSEYVKTLKNAMTKSGADEEEINQYMPTLAVNLPILLEHDLLQEFPKEEGLIKSLHKVDKDTIGMLVYAAMTTEPEQFKSHIEAYGNNYKELMQENLASISYEDGKEKGFIPTLFGDLMLGVSATGGSLAAQTGEKEDYYFTGVNPYTPTLNPAVQQEGMRTGHLEDKSEFYKKTYGVANGVVDNVMTMAAAGGNPTAYGVLMGIKQQTADFAQGLFEGKQYWKNQRDAVTGAIVEAAIEGAGYENFVNVILPGSTSFAKNAFVGAIAEGLEEITGLKASSIISEMNNGYDEMYYDIYAQYKYAYPDMPEEELREIAGSSVLRAYVDTFVEAGITGGIITAGQTGINNIQTGVYNKKVTKVKTESMDKATTELKKKYPTVDEAGIKEVVKMTHGEFHSKATVEQTIKEMESTLIEQGLEDERTKEIVPPQATLAMNFTGKEVEIVEYGKENGEVIGFDSEGNGLRTNDLTFTDPVMKDVIDYANLHDDSKTVNDFIKGYERSNVDPETYNESFMAFENKGRSMEGFNFTTAVQEVYANNIPKSVQNMAIEAGRRSRLEDAKAAPGNYPVQIKEGYAGVVKGYISKNINEDKALQIATMDRIGKQFATQIVVTDSLGKANGLYDAKSDVIYIGLDAVDGGATKALSHELTHRIKEKDSGAYDVLKDFVIDVMKKEGISVEEQVENKQKQYKRLAGEDLSYEAALEEIVADAMPDIVFTEANVMAIAQENPTVAQRIMETLKRILREIRDAFKGTPEHQAINKNIQTYEEAVRLFEGALEHVAQQNGIQFEGTESAVASSLKDDVKYSLKSFEDGTKYVEVDTDQHIFDGVPKSKYAKVARNYIKNHFFGEYFGEKKDITVTKVGAGKYAHSGETMNRNIRNTKMRAATELNNLIDAGEYLDWTDDKKNHAFAQGGFEYYRTIFKLGNEWFEGNVNVAINEVGFKQVYDINKIKVLPPAKLHQLKANALGKMDGNTSTNLSIDVNNSDVNSNNLKKSLKTTAEANTEKVMKENQSLHKIVEHLKGQMRLSKDVKLNATDIRNIAKSVAGEYNSSINIAELTTDLNTIFTHMANNPDANMVDVMEAVSNVTKGVLLKSETQVNTDVQEDAKDLRNYLRKTGIALTESQKSEVGKIYGSYDEFRKAHFGTLKLTDNGISLDSAWGDIKEIMPGYFDSNVNEGDMPVYLAEVLANATPQYENLYEMDIDQLANDVAIDVLEQFSDVRIDKTFADKQKDLRLAQAEKYKGQIKKEREKYRSNIRDLKQEHRRKLSDQSLKIREDIRTRNERTAGRGVQRRDVVRKMNSLSTALRSNTDARNVPYELRGVIERAMPALDFTTKLTKDARIKLIADLQTELRLLEGQTGNYQNSLLADVYDSDIANMVENLLAWVKEARVDENNMITSLGRLEDMQLNNVFKLMGSLHHMVTEYKEMFVNGRKVQIDSLAQVQLEAIGEMKDKKNYGKLAAAFLNPLDEAFNHGFVDAQTFFYPFKNTPLWDLFVDIQKSSEQGAFKLVEAQKALKDALDNNTGYKIKEGEKNNLTVLLEDGTTLPLSKEQAMYIHAVDIREQYTGTRHLLEGGMSFAKPNGTSEVVKFTKGDIQAINDLLTGGDKAYVQALMEFSKVTAGWGNETSLKLHGIEKFGEDPYVAFRVDRNELITSQSNVKIDPEVKNMGMTKRVNEKAVSALNAQEFTKVWSTSVEAMVTYSQLAIPLDNLKRFLNYKDYDNNRNHMSQALNRKIGKMGMEYIQNFRRMAAGALQSDRGSSLVNKAMAMAKSSAIGANLRVVIQQPTSVVRAAAEMEVRDLAYGMTKKGVRRKTYEEIKKYSALGIIKEQGRFDLNSRMNIYNEARGNVKESIQNVTGWMAQMGDEMTFNTIWEGSKHYIERTTSLEKGSEAYWKAVTAYFENVITKTQVIDTSINRVQWANGDIMQYYTAFKSEPFKTYNLIRRAVVDIQNGDVKKGLKAFSSVFLSTIVTSAFASIVSAWRDDEDEFKESYIDEQGRKRNRVVRVRTYWDKWLEAFIGDVPDNFVSAVPFAGDVYSTLQGYSSSRIETKGIESIARFGKLLISDTATDEEKVNAGARAVSDITGIPIYNVKRDVSGIVNTIHNFINEEMLKGTAYDETKPFMVRFEAAKKNIDPKKDAGFYYDLLAMVKMEGLKSEENLITNYLVQNGKSKQTIYTAVNQRTSNKMKEAREGAELQNKGDLRGYEASIRKIVAKGFSEDFAISMINYQKNQIASAEKIAVEAAVELRDGNEENQQNFINSIIGKGYSKEEAESLIKQKLSGLKSGTVKAPEIKEWEEKQQGKYTNDNLSMAIEMNNASDISLIVSDMKRVGRTDSAIKSSITGKIKPIYIEALESGDSVAISRIEGGLTSTGLYSGDKSAKEVLTEWGSNYYYSNLYESINSSDRQGAMVYRDKIKKFLGESSEDIKKMQSRIKNKYSKEELTEAQKEILTIFGFSLSAIENWGRKK